MENKEEKARIGSLAGNSNYQQWTQNMVPIDESTISLLPTT